MNILIQLKSFYWLRGVAIQGELKFIHPEEGVHSFELVGKSAKEANIEYDDPLMELFY